MQQGQILFWMKKIGFLSFGHWDPSRQSAAQSARDVLQKSIELAIAADELGADGASFRVHQFARHRAPAPTCAFTSVRARSRLRAPFSLQSVPEPCASKSEPQ